MVEPGDLQNFQKILRINTPETSARRGYIRRTGRLLPRLLREAD